MPAGANSPEAGMTNTDPGGGGAGNDLRRLSRNGESLYKLLDVPKDSPSEEIRRKYRRLALKYHPDKNPNNPEAEEMFKSINKAHSILSDEKKREVYDKYGSFGLYLADQVGEEGVGLLMMLSSKWFQCLFLSCCLLTGCYFCCCGFCCCCCCCGKCKPEDEKGDSEVPDVANFEEDEPEGGVGVVTQQPSSGQSPARNSQLSANGQKSDSPVEQQLRGAIPMPPPSTGAAFGDNAADESTALNDGGKFGYTTDMTSNTTRKAVPGT